MKSRIIRQTEYGLASFNVSPIAYVSAPAVDVAKGFVVGGGFAAAILKKDAYAWSIPLDAVLGMGIANADC